MFSKKWISALFTTLALFAYGCSSSDTGTGEESLTGASSQEALIAPCTTLPLVTDAFLGCTAFDISGAALMNVAESASFMAASSIQADLAAQLNTVFATMQVIPNIAASTVTITSTADAFLPFFGADIILPLGVDGFFTGIVPFTVTGFPELALSVWGQFPIIDGTLATMPLTALNLSVGLGSSSLAASTAALSANIATSNALLATTFPLGFTCNATLPLTCPGLAPTGFVAPALATPVLAAPIAVPGLIIP